jgi:type I restriction enzyme S subunit
MAVYKFEDIAFNSTEKKKPVEEDKYTYLGLEHLDPDSIYVTRFGADVAPKGEKLVMKKGDVLFGKRRAYQKKVAIAPFDGIFSAHGMVLRPKEDVIDKDFFPLFIKSDYFLDEAIKISVGSLSPTINWRDLKELKFSLPSLAEQKKLAQVLWSIYETKEEYKKLIKATDDLVKSQFIEMFGSPCSVSKYEKTPIGNVGEVLTGTTPSMKRAEFYDSEDILFIKPGDIKENTVQVIDKSENYISDKARKSARIFPEGSVLVTCIGTIGKVGIAKFESSCNQQINVVVPRTDIDSTFLAYNILIMRSVIQDAANAPVVPILNKTDFSKLEVLVPPYEEQCVFSKFAHQSDKSKFELRDAIDNLDALSKKIISENLIGSGKE